MAREVAGFQYRATVTEGNAGLVEPACGALSTSQRFAGSPAINRAIERPYSRALRGVVQSIEHASRASEERNGIVCRPDSAWPSSASGFKECRPETREFGERRLALGA